MWSGLGQAATVAQLVGADVGSLISVIMQAAMTARQNKKECEQLARRVFMIAELLPHLQDPEVMRRPEVRRPLAGLDDALREAHELVTSCQGRAAAYRLVMAWRQAERFREVQSKIDSYLLVFPFISHIDITRRLDRIYRVLLPNDAIVPSASAGLPNHEMEGERFTMSELAAATNNFATDRQIGTNPVARVYKGWLADGREVAVKQLVGNSNLSLAVEEEFQAELSLLSIRHSHIVRLLGWCAAEEKHLVVYEYMKNGTLDDHLHGAPSSSPSPVTTSWRTRVEILLGVSRAVEHLQSSDGERRRPVIHRDIKPSNILLDDAWAPRLTDFGLSLTWDERECSSELPVVGTCGYAAPEYVATGRIRPASDVYGLGVVMLEVLTGRKALSQRAVVLKDGCTRFARESLVDLALPMIWSGKARKLLDKRLTPTPTRRQLRAADMVVRTAARCLLHDWVKRPAISEVVVDLKAALELVRFDLASFASIHEDLCSKQASQDEQSEQLKVDCHGEMWSGMGQAATVAQLVGADVGRLISMIMQAALTAQWNKECEQLARRDPEVMRRPEVRRSLAGLGDTLRRLEIAMALWGGLGQTATVAQLVGVDVGRLVSMIMHAALTARQNKRECEQLARRVFMIGELLPHLQDSSVMRRPEVRRPLMLLGGMLREAHELVASCQGRSTVYQLVAAGRQAEKFRDIQRRIDSYLLLFPFISHIDITRRLDRIHREMIPSDHPKPTSLPSPSTGSQNHEAVVIQDVINLAGLAAATNNFAPDREIGKGGFSTVYMTRLPDGREVAIKRIDSASMEEDTLREATMLPSLRHEHIIRLFGWVSVRKKQHRQQPFWKKRKENQVEHIFVYEYLKNGSLHDHLHDPSFSSSPLRASWHMRIKTLLGVAQAVEYLHCYAQWPVIHRDIKPSNILLDDAWAPRLSDFGMSLIWDEANDDNGPTNRVYGTFGYMDPEYYMTCVAKPTMDVYSFGVTMLEVITGRRAVFNRKEEDMRKAFDSKADGGGIPTNLVEATVPRIKANNKEQLQMLFDKRPNPNDLLYRDNFEALELVAHTAVRCVQLEGKDRPTISKVQKRILSSLVIAMALWGGLGQAATVAQLVGVDAGGLISMIMQAAVTAQQNKKECEQLARRVFMIAELLPHLQDPEVMRRPEIQRPLVGLDDTLREAHELVISCQEKNAMHRLVMAGRQAEKFREVQSRIDSYLFVIPIIGYIGVTRRLDRIYRVLLPNDTPVSSPSTGSRTHELLQLNGHLNILELAEEAAQEVVFHGEECEKFTFAELATATNNFASDKLIGRGGVSFVYMGRLPDGREVAIKLFKEGYLKEFFNAEHTILSHIHHKHIIRLFGCCMERQYKQEIKHYIRRLLATEPTAKQLQAAELVAHTAASCVQLEGKDRPAMSEVVAKLQEAVELAKTRNWQLIESRQLLDESEAKAHLQWKGMDRMASIAQLSGMDALGIISMIMQMGKAVRWNKETCQELMQDIQLIRDLLRMLHDPEVMCREEIVNALSGLEGTLKEAYALVTSCRDCSAMYRFFMGWKQADQFHHIKKKIGKHLRF
uniref:non-specific serine/threonine protein kinase n=1 Tax=Oryza meridionalis TaxID=40149 RepID=A0A0E0F8D6_9ORYZ